MKQMILGLLTAASTALAACAAFANPAPLAAGERASLVQKTGGVYLEFGGPRHYDYNSYYYDRYPAYGYYGPRRYYSYGDGYYDRRWHSRRWTQERFKHPLGRR